MPPTPALPEREPNLLDFWAAGDEALDNFIKDLLNKDPQTRRMMLICTVLGVDEKHMFNYSRFVFVLGAEAMLKGIAARRLEMAAMHEVVPDQVRKSALEELIKLERSGRKEENDDSNTGGTGSSGNQGI